MKRLLAVLFSLFIIPTAYSAPNLTAKINMDIRATTGARAKSDATDAAVRSGVIQVLSRYSDRAIVENLLMGADDAQLQTFVATMSISNERVSKTAYAADFSITIDRTQIEKWYTENNVANFLAAADDSDERQIIHIEMSNGLDDWTLLNQAMRDSGDSFGLTVRSIYNNSATAYILTAKRRKFQTMCANSGWHVSFRDGILHISK